MDLFIRFVAFEAVGWLVVGAVCTWLAHEGHVEPWLAVMLFTAWVFKDIALYPATRSAYELGTTHGSGELLGTEVRIVSTLDPEGFVTTGPERWRARLAPGYRGPMYENQWVRVCALQGLTLIVEPVEVREGPNLRARGRKVA